MGIDSMADRLRLPNITVMVLLLLRISLLGIIDREEKIDDSAT